MSMPSVSMPSLANPIGDPRGFSDSQLCGALWGGDELILERQRRLIDCPPQDLKTLQARADSGDGGAMNELGSRLVLGRDGPPNPAEGCRWFQTAADMGHVNATANLAMCFEQGIGRRKGGQAEAARLYALAAEANSALAQNQLADMLWRGSGIPKDPVAALKWWTIAASGGMGPGSQAIREKAARSRDRALGTIEADQAHAARRQATAWIAQRSSRPGAPPLPEIPLIDVPAEIEVSGPVVELDGRVSGLAQVRSLTVDGTPVEVRNGAFRLSRHVPIGTSEIQILAQDEKGRTGSARIAVTRAPTAIDPDFPPLNPLALKGKPRPQALALIIGIEGYEDAPPAEFAERDARAFYDYATHALGIPEARVKLLAGSGARRLDVLKALDTWLVPRIGADSEVFVFFSGHGLASEDGRDTFLLPHDGDRAMLAKSTLRRRDLIAAITAARPKSLRLFLDTCYSGATRSGEALIASARPILMVSKDTDVPAGVIVHSAAGGDQLSSSLKGARHGLFSYFLMRGLGGEADADGDRRITDAEIYAYVGERIPRQAATLGRGQTPQLAGEGAGVLVSW